MRAKDIIGKRVAAVRQQRTKDDTGATVWHCAEIVFEDGSSVSFRTSELPGDYATLATFWPAKKEAARG